MQFNVGGLILGAGLVILHKKNPEILSDLLLPIKSILSGNDYFSKPHMAIDKEDEMARNVADITKKIIKKARTEKESRKETVRRDKNTHKAEQVGGR